MCPEPIESRKPFPVETLAAAELPLVVGQVALLVVLQQEGVRELFAALQTPVHQFPVVCVDHGHVAPERRVVELLLADLLKKNLLLL